MPLYEDLARRVVAARDKKCDARRASELADLLREAGAGMVMLVRCAWCDAFQLADEWLRLEAIGEGQARIIHALRDQATHGICPPCLETQLTRSAAHRPQTLGSPTGTASRSTAAT